MTEKPVALPSPTMERKLDGKFSIRGWQIVNTVSGEAIPEDEPLFLLRGRDHLALVAIHAYQGACEAECNELHMAGIQQVREKFCQFAAYHPERMKQPGITKHLKLEVALPSSPAPAQTIGEFLAHTDDCPCEPCVKFRAAYPLRGESVPSTPSPTVDPEQ